MSSAALSPLEAAIQRCQHSASWELQAMVKALSLHPWHNTADDELRRLAAAYVLKQRRKRPTYTEE
jgi:hypothetical protein